MLLALFSILDSLPGYDVVGDDDGHLGSELMEKRTDDVEDEEFQVIVKFDKKRLKNAGTIPT